LTIRLALFEVASPNWFVILTVYTLPVSDDLQDLISRIEVFSLLVIICVSFGMISSLSFLNQVILDGAGFEMNLHTN
jgi:hypothetical protein